MSRLLLAAFILLALSAAPVAAQAPAQPNPKEDDRLVCIGALSGAHIYTTYGYIGGVADLYGHQVYKADRVQDLMREVVGVANVSIKQLRKVREGIVDAGDKQVIDDMCEVYDLLQKEALALSAYARTSDKRELDAFEKARNDVWPKIRKVLGIEAGASTGPAPIPAPLPPR